MRKLRFLVLFVALGLFGMTTFAQEVEEAVEAVVQEKIEVKLSELPDAVKKAIGSQFADATAEKAYKVSKDGAEVYHVKFAKGGVNTMVHFDAEGKVIGKKLIE